LNQNIFFFQFQFSLSNYVYSEIQHTIVLENSIAQWTVAVIFIPCICFSTYERKRKNLFNQLKSLRTTDRHRVIRLFFLYAHYFRGQNIEISLSFKKIDVRISNTLGSFCLWYVCKHLTKVCPIWLSSSPFSS